MTIRIRRKSQAEWLTLFILVMPFLFFFFLDLLHLPSLIKYTVDLAWVFLVLLMIINHVKLPNKQVRNLAFVVFLFFFLSLASVIWHYQSVFYFLWGLRNNVRFFVFFFACILYLKEKNVNNYLRLFDVIFWLNIPIIMYQYLIMGKAWDFLGGVFGVQTGCNAYMNIFMLIVVSKSVLLYFHKKESGQMCALKCVVALIIAALAEIKVFVFEFMLLLLMVMAMTKRSSKKVWIAMIAIICIPMSIRLLYKLYPSFAGWFTVDKILGILTSDRGYTSLNDMNRQTALPIAWNRFLGSWFEKLFGLGLGNCDYASFDFLITPFYASYKKLHYMWFSSAFLLLETGLVGLVIYILFFVLVWRNAQAKAKKVVGDALVYCQLAQIMSVLAVVLVFYNVSLRTEAGFMVYFVLSLPFIQATKSIHN